MRRSVRISNSEISIFRTSFEASASKILKLIPVWYEDHQITENDFLELTSRFFSASLYPHFSVFRAKARVWLQLGRLPTGRLFHSGIILALHSLAI